MTKHPLGRGFSSVPHYTVECSRCGAHATWATPERINAFWAKIRGIETMEAVLSKLKCEKCGGTANRIEFDYSPVKTGV